MKIILSSYYWGVHEFEKWVTLLRTGFTFLENGVHFYENNIIIFVLLRGSRF